MIQIFLTYLICWPTISLLYFSNMLKNKVLHIGVLVNTPPVRLNLSKPMVSSLLLPIFSCPVKTTSISILPSFFLTSNPPFSIIFLTPIHPSPFSPLFSMCKALQLPNLLNSIFLLLSTLLKSTVAFYLSSFLQ